MSLEQSLAATTNLGEVDSANLDQLRSERDRFVALAFCSADMLFEPNGEGIIEFAGGVTEAFIGQRASAVVDMAFLNLVAPQHRHFVDRLLSNARAGGRIDNVAIHLIGPAGETPPPNLSGFQLAEFGAKTYLSMKMMASLRALEF